MPATLLKLRSAAPAQIPGGGDPEPPPPSSDAPRNLAVTDTTDQIALSWQLPSSTTTGTNTVHRSLTTTGPWVRLATTPANTPSYIDTELGTGMQRAYYVTFTPEGGSESPRSGIVTATQASGTPYTIVGEDAFIAETPDIALAAHASDLTWTLMPYSTGTPKLSSLNRLYGLGSSNQQAVAYADAAPPAADYAVTTTIIRTATGSNRVGPVGRLDPTDTAVGSGTFYHARYDASVGAWQLWAFIRGSAFQIGSNYPQTLTVGQPYRCTLQMQGSVISLLVDGITRVSATHTGITAAGRAGVRLFGSGSPTGGLQQQAFIIELGTGTPDTTAPAAPLNLTTSVLSTGIALEWDNPDTPDFNNTHVYRSTVPGGPYDRITTGELVTGSGWFDSNVVAGTTYYYCVSALDGFGNESRFSTERSATAVGSGTDNPDAIDTFGATYTLSATFNTIALRLAFTSDPNRSASAAVSISTDGGTTWTPRSNVLWRPLPQGGAADVNYWQGRIEYLQPNTTYHVKVDVTDPDGINGPDTFTGSITTRAENIPVAATLTPTHYIDAINGSDTNSGALGSPWQTVAHAWKNAPANAIVQIAPGYYLSSESTRTTPIMFMAQPGSEACGDGGVVINPGNHVVIESRRGTRPIGSASTGENANLTENRWELLPAGTVIDSYTLPVDVWKFPDFLTTVSNTTQLFVAPTRAATPIRVCVSVRQDATVGLRLQWLLEGFTTEPNPRYHYGCIQSPDKRDLYLVMPPYVTAMDPDPNNLYWTVGAGTSFPIKFTDAVTVNATYGATVRFSGLELRPFGTGPYLWYGSHHCVFDHNHLIVGAHSLYMQTDRSTLVTGHDHVIEHNRISDSSLRAEPGEDSSAASGLIPWSYVKYNSSIAKHYETEGIKGNLIHDRTVIRDNVIDGPFNGIVNTTSGFSGFSCFHVDIYRNTFKNLSDDTLEFENHGMCVGAWENRVQHCSTFMSLAPSQFGPHHLFNNTIYRLGALEVPALANGGNKGPHGNQFKVSTSNMQVALIRYVNNTYWADDYRSEGWAHSNTGSGGYPAMFCRNNIIRVAWHPWNRAGLVDRWDEDANWLAYSMILSDPAATDNGSVQIGGSDYRSVNTYIARTEVGPHVNQAPDGSYFNFLEYGIVDAQFVDVENGDLRLRPEAELVAEGTPVLFHNNGTTVDNFTPPDETVGAPVNLGSRERLDG